jgi:hypothetical protein
MSVFAKLTDFLGVVHVPTNADIQKAGGHAINADIATARTHHQALDAYNPGNFASIRSAQRVANPHYATAEDVEVARALARQTTEQLKNSTKMYQHLAAVDANDVALHQTHRRYETGLVKGETRRRIANAKHAVATHRERPKVAAAHASIQFADGLYGNHVAQVQARLHDRKQQLG